MAAPEGDNPRGQSAGDKDFPQVLTTAMAADMLHVHVEHLRRLVREGVIPSHRFPGGREIRFDRDELLDWLRAQPGEDRSTSTKKPRPSAN